MELFFLGTSGAIPTAQDGNVSLVLTADGTSLIQALWLMKRVDTLILLANRPTCRIAEEILSLFNLAARNSMYQLVWRTDDDSPVPIGSSLRVTLFPVEHALPTSGVRFQSGETALVYSSDTAPCSKVLEMAQGCSALIHEASGPMSRREQLNEAGHSTGFQAGEIAARAGVETLFLCHFDRIGGSMPEDMESEASISYSGDIVIPMPFHRYWM